MSNSPKVYLESPGSYALGPFRIVRIAPRAWSVGDSRTGDGLDAFQTYAEAKRYAWRLTIAENERTASHV